MKKSTAALATLVTAAGLAGGTVATAQAHPLHTARQAAAHHTSKVAVTRLHALLAAPGGVSARGVIRPEDGGGTTSH